MRFPPRRWRGDGRHRGDADRVADHKHAARRADRADVGAAVRVDQHQRRRHADVHLPGGDRLRQCRCDAVHHDDGWRAERQLATAPDHGACGQHADHHAGQQPCVHAGGCERGQHGADLARDRRPARRWPRHRPGHHAQPRACALRHHLARHAGQHRPRHGGHHAEWRRCRLHQPAGGDHLGRRRQRRERHRHHCQRRGDRRQRLRRGQRLHLGADGDDRPAALHDQHDHLRGRNRHAEPDRAAVHRRQRHLRAAGPGRSRAFVRDRSQRGRRRGRQGPDLEQPAAGHLPHPLRHAAIDPAPDGPVRCARGHRADGHHRGDPGGPGLRHEVRPGRGAAAERDRPGAEPGRRPGAAHRGLQRCAGVGRPERQVR